VPTARRRQPRLRERGAAPAAKPGDPKVPGRPAAPGACAVRFGGSAAGLERDRQPPALRVALDPLGGDDHEQLLAAAEAGEENGCCLFRAGDLTAGFAVARPDLDLEAATGELYQRLFAATAGRHLLRIWNYVPHINREQAGLENYRRFCRARAAAFEARFGPAFQPLLPASSAVGAAAGPLAVAFLAGTAPGRHLENPLQVPAFRYPAEHGPRPPSFSRATVAETAAATHVFISGTAAIRGHATVAPGDRDAQLACTLENLAAIGETAGIGPTLGAGSAWRRRFKVYLRQRDDFPAVKSRLESGLLRPGDRVAYLQAEICRPELVLEIEATLAGPRRSRE